MKEHPKRKSEEARRANRTIRVRTMLVMGLLGVAAFAVLFGRLYYLQIIRHKDLQEQAVTQQTRSTVITASRGSITDRDGNVLAISATAETVFISPAEIKEHEEDQDADYIARGLSRILEIPEETIVEHMEKTSSQYEILKKKVDQDIADEIRRFINGEIDDEGEEIQPDKDGDYQRLYGIYMESDSKRHYPYGSLASQVIGFVNADNVGAYGLEAIFNDELTGSSGLVVTAKNAAGTDMLYQYEQYYDAENGNNLVTTIDSTVQYYLESGLKEMVEKYDAKNGASGIILNVNTGAVLAMASLPDYDLNDPWAIQDEKLLESLEGLEGDALTEAKGAAQLKQWRNKNVNDTYEPGSTFKILTLSAALEEGVVNMNTQFTCTGSISVPGWSQPINCSKRAGHGLQTLKVATGNSCNPAFITMGLKLGTTTYYQYMKDFGLMEATGIELNGEQTGIFASEEDFGKNVVSLAAYAFGQTCNVTPIALITAQAACVNGGYLRTPYLVEQILDDDGNIVFQHDSSTPVRQVISEDTSATVRECLEYVVSSGTGKNGQVAGYRIGGKTGTADKTGSKTASNPRGDVVVSFVCFAPADDPEIIMLLTMDTPSRNTGTYVSGGNMVAPTASKIMAEVLPELGIQPDYASTDLANADTTVPNVVGMTLEEAKERLNKSGFAYKTVGSGATVTDQTPVGGAIVPGTATIILYLGQEKPDALCTVPNVVGKTAEQANVALTNAGLILKVAGTTSSSSGNVLAISQSETAGSQVEAGTVVTVQFGDSSMLD